MAITRQRPARFARFARSVCWIATLVAVIAVCGDLRVVADAPGSTADGPQPTHGYFSDLPFEQIDMLDGTLQLTIPVFSLPGNAGMDLNVLMAFSRPAGWKLVLAGLPMVVQNPSGPTEGHDLVIQSFDRSEHTAYLGRAPQKLIQP